ICLTAMPLATSPALCPPMPSASTSRPMSGSTAMVSSLCSRTLPVSVSPTTRSLPLKLMLGPDLAAAAECDTRHFPFPGSSRHKLALRAAQSEWLVTNPSFGPPPGANPSQVGSRAHRCLADFFSICLQLPRARYALLAGAITLAHARGAYQAPLEACRPAVGRCPAAGRFK